MKLLGILFVAAFVAADIVRYDGYKVFRVTPQNAEQALILKSFEINENYDFWSELKKNGPVDIMVTPQAQSFFQSFLKQSRIPHEVIIENVEAVLEQERVQQMRAVKGQGRINFNQYQRYEDIEIYLEGLARDFPTICTLEVAATSTEGRNVTGIRISTGGSVPKPIILVDAGIHAREWIAPAQALYIIQQLVENPNNYDLLASVDWHVIPLVNPDGYEHTHTTARLWRKTRSPGTQCIGVDGNRNFDFHWMGAGASDNECSEIYAGPVGFSEPETRGIRDWVNKYGSQIKVYITFHSYGNMILYPWGYTAELPDNWMVLHNLGTDAGNAIQNVAGTRYVVGSSTNVLYEAAGGADDWVKGVGDVDVAYTIELPGGGTWGFDLPPTRIAAVVQETWAGILVFHEYAQLQEV